MYCAIRRALAPVSIFWLATLFDGHSLTDVATPAFCASALIADGVMSGEPTMYSLERLLLTVCRPLTPIVMATAPNTMRTAAATSPPISKNLRMSRLLSIRGAFVQVSGAAAHSPSGSLRKCVAGNPLAGGRNRAGDIERRDNPDR